MLDEPAHTTTAPGETGRLGCRRGLQGAIAGAVAAGFALSVGHAVAGAAASLVSPVIAVGERVIEQVPTSIEQWAIRTFGSKDKPVLVAGIVVVCLVLGAALGVISRRRLAPAVGGFVAFSVVGVLASLNHDRSLVAAVIPSALAAAAGIAALAALRSIGATHERSHQGLEPTTAPMVEAPVERPKWAWGTRRGFLVAAGGLAVASIALRSAGSALRSRFSAAGSRAALSLPSANRPLPPLPPTVEAPITGIAPFTTPNDAFYRVDTALLVPQVRAEDWTLRIHGMVERPVELTFDELLRRPLVEADITLVCVSNTVGGKLVGNARWLGVPLVDLLRDAGVDPQADQIVGRSVDGWTCGFPVRAASDRNALVAIGMNGEPLPLEHGFPARLVVPGLYGYVSACKWLAEIELTTFADFDPYWVRRGWASQAPVKTMARIDTPKALSSSPAGPMAIGGVAWAPTRGISAVEVRIDDGPWQTARLADVPGPDTWRQWWLPWDATPGRHTLTARATDGTGELQTDIRSEPFPDGASGLHQILVTVT